MGLVFSWKQASNGLVPKAEDFEQVRNLLSVGLQSPSIVAACLYGSVQRGDWSCRSDIDVAVVYDEAHEVVAMEHLNALVAAAKKRHATLTFTPCSKQVAASQGHFFGPGFLAHLSRSDVRGGRLVGDIPVAEYFESALSPSEELKGYLRHKLHKLGIGRAHFDAASEEVRMRVLTKTLEAPTNVARKVLSQRGLLKENDSKSRVVSTYLDSVSDAEGNEFAELIGLDAQYSRLLVGLLERDAWSDDDRREYAAFLNHIAEQSGRVIAFVERATIRMTNKRDG